VPISLSEYYKNGTYVKASDITPNVASSGTQALSNFRGSSKLVLTYIGANYRDGPGALNYPVGTQTGDLIVYIQAGFGYTAPSVTAGTFVFQYSATAVTYGYVRTVWTKLSNGEAGISNTQRESLFGQEVYVFRGASAVHTSWSFSDMSLGATVPISITKSGMLLCSAHDRGAGYPVFSGPAGRTSATAMSYALTYFTCRSHLCTNYQSGDIAYCTEVADAYTTNVCGIVVY